MCCSLITADPFTIINLMVSVVGTISVFLMPVMAWIQINGGFGFVFSLGMYGRDNIRNKKVVNVGDGGNETKTEGEVESKASIIGMLAAQSVFWLSCAFIIIGVIISGMELYQKAKVGQGIHWRQTVFPLDALPETQQDL